MKVTVYYDYICPFCFLGFKRLEVLEKEFPMEIEFKGIEIHPEIPPHGVKRSRNAKLLQIAHDVTQISKEDGVKIKLPAVIASSRLSLEASEFAKTRNKFTEFHNGIYEAYFHDEENIGNREVIFKVAEKAGLQGKELEECLDKRTMLEKIQENKKEAEMKQILGVPAFIFGSFPIHGVQSLESFRIIINRMIERKLA